ncbi:head decoration protein [Hydrogenimonas sp.]
MSTLIVSGPIVTDTEILEAGQTLARGAALGKVTETGKLKLSAKTLDDGTEVSDGSENVYAILLDDADATAGDSTIGVIKAGEINEAALTFGNGHTAASTKEAFRMLGIYLKTIA